jgi:hypothetical protein
LGATEGCIVDLHGQRRQSLRAAASCDRAGAAPLLAVRSSAARTVSGWLAVVAAPDLMLATSPDWARLGASERASEAALVNGDLPRILSIESGRDGREGRGGSSSHTLTHAHDLTALTPMWHCAFRGRER